MTKITTIEYNAETTELSVYSSVDGTLLLRMEGLDFKQTYQIEQAIKRAEKIAIEAERKRFAAAIDQFLEDTLGML